MEKLFIFDLETTGVRYWKNGIHQMSGMLFVDGIFKAEFNFRVQPNPKCIIEDDALAIAGVTREEIQAYRPMKEVYDDIVQMLAFEVDKFDKTDKFHLMGFNNAGFDNPFFRAFFTQNATTKKEEEYGNYFGSWFWSDSIDVMVLASHYLRKERHLMKDFKLATVAAYLGIKVDESRLHDALYDIILTYEVYKIVTKEK